MFAEAWTSAPCWLSRNLIITKNYRTAILWDVYENMLSMQWVVRYNFICIEKFIFQEVMQKNGNHVVYILFIEFSTKIASQHLKIDQ